VRAVAGLIPHAGRMCLLDTAIEWSDDAVVCVATSHRDPSNPLRRDDLLPASSAIEYAAQAAAVHGALLAPAGPPRAGMLASARDVRFAVERLDTVAGDLTVRATTLTREPDRVLYEFAIDCAGAPVAAGRLAVVLQT
jgi:predicted hotdog family 3-hydroxylacyl-ACP dehydratase